MSKVKGIPEDYPSGSDIKEVGYYKIEDSFRCLAGKILTIIDASINDKVQLKAIKDLIKQDITREIDLWQNYYWNGSSGHGVILESKNSDPLN